MPLDIKAANILLKGGVAKVCDFGLSKELRFKGEIIQVPGGWGTLSYMSPEIHDGQASFHGDWWAYAVVCYQIFAKAFVAPFGGDQFMPGGHPATIKEKVKAREESPSWKDIDPRFAPGLKRFFLHDVTERIQSADQVEAVLFGGQVPGVYPV